MKKVLLSLLAVMTVTTLAYAYNYDKTIPVKGGTLADGKLQADMLFPVYAYGLRIAAPDCKERMVLGKKCGLLRLAQEQLIFL